MLKINNENLANIESADNKFIVHFCWWTFSWELYKMWSDKKSMYGNIRKVFLKLDFTFFSTNDFEKLESQKNLCHA